MTNEERLKYIVEHSITDLQNTIDRLTERVDALEARTDASESKRGDTADVTVPNGTPGSGRR